MEPIKVLVAADGSEPVVRACQFAADRVGMTDASVRLLTVLSFTMDPYTLLGEELEDTPARLEAIREAVDEATRIPAKIFEAAGATVQVYHRFGNPADEILAEIDQWQPDLLLMGRRGLSGPERWLLGSVSERLIRHAKVPILVVT
jgi:nucleotide-binding universal stress UspA family protein